MGGEGRGRERGKKGSYGEVRNGNARKNSPKCSIFGIMGTPLWGYRPVPHILGDVRLMA